MFKLNIMYFHTYLNKQLKNEETMGFLYAIVPSTYIDIYKTTIHLEFNEIKFVLADFYFGKNKMNRTVWN